MTTGSILLAATLAVPLALLVICLVSERARIGLPLAPVPALAAALLAPDGSTLTLPDALLGLTLTLDKPGALLLGTAALLWIAAALYAGADGHARTRGFGIWWLTTLTGSLGVFIAADMVGFYLFFTLVSLAAYWLVIDSGTPTAKRAGAVYVSFALLSEAFLLLAFVLLAAGAPDNSLLIRDAVAALSVSPSRDAVLAFVILGFGAKIALLPMHVWMPPTYTAAPIPVAAALSGAAVKAGVIGLIRFLPFDTALPGWGEALVVLGFCSAFYGVAIGMTQRNPMTVLAYSSVSQMGVIATLLGMGLAAGDSSVAILVAFYALHHILAKGGLFLALGVASQSRARRSWLVLVPAAIVALGLGGLPLTGGALAKLAVKDILGDGLAALCGTLSTIASTVLMLHFIRRMNADIGVDARSDVPSTALISWLGIAAGAIVVPWTLYAFATDKPLLDAVLPSAIWSSAWPVLAGLVLGVVLERGRSAIPSVPVGDILAGSDAIRRGAATLGAGIASIDRQLNLWPLAGVLFLFVTIMLAAAMFMTRWA
jgi:formate hydrogenlyase subunit 3/multisubunit Na+/H+ antiporter MnhD subunit